MRTLKKAFLNESLSTTSSMYLRRDRSRITNSYLNVLPDIVAPRLGLPTDIPYSTRTLDSKKNQPLKCKFDIAFCRFPIVGIKIIAELTDGYPQLINGIVDWFSIKSPYATFNNAFCNFLVI